MGVKGIVFTLDSIIAFGMMVFIISFLVFFRTETSTPYLQAQQLHSMSEDILTVFTESKLNEVVSQSLLSTYISNGILNDTDLDKQTIEIIGALWAAQKDEEAANITKDVLDSFIPQNMGYQLLIDSDNVYNSSDTTRPAYTDSDVDISSGRIVSGYEKYKPVSGFVSRAWATKVKRKVTKIIPMNLVWGEYSDPRYWFNGYAPQEIRDQNEWAMMEKNFSIPDDANITYAYLQLALDNDYTRVYVNGNNVFDQSGLRGVIRDVDITDDIQRGLNTIRMDFRNTGSDIAHFHPGSFIKLEYNTSEVLSGSNKTVFNASLIRGVPAANEIIPFFVNSQINNVTAFVDVRDVNAFLLLTLNYKYEPSNPRDNVLLYREYPTANSCEDLTDQGECEACGCTWNSSGSQRVVFWHGFEDMGCQGSNCFNTTVWSPIERGNDGNEVRVQSESSYSGTYAAEMEEGDEGEVAISTAQGLIDLTGYVSCTLSMNVQFMDTWEDSDDVYIDIYDGSWDYGAFKIDVNENNYDDGAWHQFSFDIDSADYTFGNNFRFRIDHEADSDSEEAHYDDINLTCSSPCSGTPSTCEYIDPDEVKDRKYDIVFNDTGTLIKEYNSTDLLNTWFNTNITINNIYNNVSNTLGIYADIRPPTNATVEGTSDVDWQRLGMYASDGTADHGSDYFSYITENSNVTMYHDIERYGLEYGRIDITRVEDFNNPELLCVEKDVWSCKDADLNLTFNFSTDIILSRVIGTQEWGGMDNGYNFIWIWNEDEDEEENIGLDTDTPPGTFSYLPVQYFETDKINYVRVGDKDSGRYLNTDVSPLTGNVRSLIEYSFLAPSQVSYGDVFENQTAAMEDAIDRLKVVMGEDVTTIDISVESFSVSGVPYMWGPAEVRLRMWV